MNILNSNGEYYVYTVVETPRPRAAFYVRMLPY